MFCPAPARQDPRAQSLAEELLRLSVERLRLPRLLQRPGRRERTRSKKTSPTTACTRTRPATRSWRRWQKLPSAKLCRAARADNDGRHPAIASHSSPSDAHALRLADGVPAGRIRACPIATSSRRATTASGRLRRKAHAPSRRLHRALDRSQSREPPATGRRLPGQRLSGLLARCGPDLVPRRKYRTARLQDLRRCLGRLR